VLLLQRFALYGEFRSNSAIDTLAIYQVVYVPVAVCVTLAPALRWSIIMLPLMILFLPTTLLTLGVTELMVAVLPAFASVIALTAIELIMRSPML
jgi:hypothetical protein